jgi:predicted regulator of Ras-like GTPase activity (Roadblock/LC7/MglB family)
MQPLRSVLLALADRPEVAGVAVVSDEGLIVESALPGTLDPDAVAAHAVTVLRHLGSLGGAVAHGAPRQLVAEGANGVLVLQRLQGGATLLVLAAQEGDLGALLYDLRRHAPALEQLIEGE